MAFSPKLLNDAEEIVLDLRPHWWFMVWPTTVLVATLALGTFLLFDTDDKISRGAAGVVVLLALGWFIIRYFKWVTTNFVVTTDRCIFRDGVLSKSGIEIPLERINTVFFNQSLFERMIGAGDLAIESAGEGGRSEFSDIRRPNLVQNEIYRQMEDNENRKFDRINRVVPTSLSIPEQLEKLDDLRSRGVITAAEFDAHKADLLKRA